MKNKKFAAIFGFLAFLIACKGDPAENRDKFFKSAQEYSEKGKYQEAVIQYLNALQNDDGFVPARMGLAQAYQRQGNHQQALNQYKRVLEIDPENSEAKLALGNYYLQAGGQDSNWFREARRLAEEVIEKEPSNVAARILLGNAFAGLNNLDRSVEQMREALKEDPNSLAAILNLGAFELGRQDRETAERVFLEAVQKHPDSAEARRALGNFYAVSHQFDRAEQNFQKALELGPNESINLYTLVRFYLFLQRKEDVERVFQDQIGRNPEAREPRWGLANFYVSDGRLEEGLGLLQQLADKNPDDQLAALRIAEIQISQGNTSRAAEIVAAILEKDANSAEAHFLKGRLLKSEKKLDEALAEFSRTVELKNWLLPAYLETAAIHLQRREFSKAEENLRKVLAVDANNLPARAGLAKVLAFSRRPDDALVEASSALDRDSQNIDALTGRAEALLLQNRLAEAQAEFQMLLTLQPGNPFFLHRLGTIEGLRGNYDQAVLYFKQALADNPDLGDAINDLIFAYQKQGKFDQALQELDRLARRSQHKDLFSVFKGRIHIARKDYDAAKSMFRDAIRANPDNYQAYLLLSQVNLAQNDVQQAVREVDQLIAKDNRYAPAYLMRGMYQDAAKDVEGAIQSYRKTLELAPDNPVAANNLAWILCKSGTNLNEALTLAQSARKADPENQHYADTLGWIHYQMGHYTLAVDQLLFAVNRGDATPGNYYRLGMAYFKKGDKLLAKQSLQKALQMDSGFDKAAEAREALAELGT